MRDRAGLRFVATTPGPRALVLSLFLVVSFAAIDNVALVFLVSALHGSAADFGLTQAAYGVGMLAASGLLSLVLGRRSAVALLPSLVAVAVAQAVGGMGNAAENIATDTLVQRLAPRHLLGRAFGAVATAAQLGSAVAYVAAGPLIGLVGPRGAFLLGGVGTALALLVAMPALRAYTRGDRAGAGAEVAGGQ